MLYEQHAKLRAADLALALIQSMGAFAQQVAYSHQKTFSM